ncbi:PIG-L family deacetylase [Aquirufa ecclesiirivi]|uniref:PIG-L deacetylase family protein n=1 Tax=Aquirufa ecclesiirivi TaxID=2715124 RepID=UPI0022A89BFA|nr:PIG-L family deacetylase [Aquirufa ecclesiirivi]MCZ2473329.1 PIG-L family deacetylase [Aquirufa ecclesiirivi]
MLESLRNKRILLVVAHPDDEILGLGATMNKLIQEYGVQTHVIILGEGITSRSEVHNTEAWKQELEIHHSNIHLAQKAIGYHGVSLFNLPDNRFDSVPLLDVIKIIEKVKSEFLPNVIFTHHGGDVNIDHQRCFEAVITACRPMEHEPVKTIITFETPSGTEWRSPTDPRHFLPNFFVRVSEANIGAKIEAMESYEFEKRAFPHPRSPEALRIQAQRWGITVGSYLAEAFAIIRCIED